MLKYYLLGFAVVGIALFYAYVADPCNKLVRMEFAERYPEYQIIDSEAYQGSRETVRCRISYRKPDSDEVHRQVWLYVNDGKEGWQFSKIVATKTDDETP